MANKSAQQIVLSLLQSSKKSFSANELLAAIEGEINPRTLRRWLTVWEEEGAVKRTGKKKGTRYRGISSEPYHFTFLHAVPEYRRNSVMNQIRDVWTHTSTAIEGNTLTLGDTFNILELGLTILGKPLKEHQEIIGHARAIEQIYSLVQSGNLITKKHLFELHKSVQTERVMDINKPMGGWKVEPNGCNAVSADDHPVYIGYAHPLHVDMLMVEWLDELNSAIEQQVSLGTAVEVYAKLHIGFVHIHPFWDGNGRLARLVSNIPLLCSGLPPLVIDEARRREYVRSLSLYQIETGQLDKYTGVWPEVVRYEDFIKLCGECYQITHNLLANALGDL